MFWNLCKNKFPIFAVFNFWDMIDFVLNVFRKLTKKIKNCKIHFPILRYGRFCTQNWSIFQWFLSTKSTITQKQKIGITEKIIYAKNERQVNSNLPKTALLDARGAQTQYDVTWNFTPIFFFNSLRIFYVKMATSERGGGGVCISLVGPEPKIWISLVIFHSTFRGISAAEYFC